MTLYSQYLAEREDFSIVEDEFGFATFKIYGETVYLRDLFVVADKRMTGHAKVLAAQVIEVAKRAGCKIMTGSVDAKLKGADASVKVLHAYGMRVTGIQGNLLVFEKEI